VRTADRRRRLGGVLEVEEQTVHVTINNGIAVTEVTQVFHNTESRQVEALYTFPVPRGERGQLQHVDQRQGMGRGRREEAGREIYDSYKRVRRDPGLLEQTDYKTFEMRIFRSPRGEAEGADRVLPGAGLRHDWATYVLSAGHGHRKDLNARTTGKFASRWRPRRQYPSSR